MKASRLKYSLPFRILIASFILLVVPLLVFAFFQMKSSYQEHLNQAQDKLITLAQQKEAAIGQVTSSKLLLLEKVSFLLDLPKLLPQLPNEKTNQILAGLVQTGGFWSIGVFKITPEGRFINVGDADPFYLGRDYTDLYHLMDVIHKKTTIILNDDVRPPHEELLLAAMLVEANNIPLGAFVMAFDVTDLLKILFAPIDMPYPINFALLTRFDLVFERVIPICAFNYLNHYHRKGRLYR